MTKTELQQMIGEAVQKSLKGSVQRLVNEAIEESINEALYGEDGAVPFVLKEVKGMLSESVQSVAQPQQVVKPRLSREQMRARMMENVGNAPIMDQYGLETDEESFRQKRTQQARIIPDSIPTTVNKKQVIDAQIKATPGASKAMGALNEQLERMERESVPIDGLMAQFGKYWKKGMES